ncbi:MAG: class beta-lactamase, partial [Pseudomonadota bacterium]
MAGFFTRLIGLTALASSAIVPFAVAQADPLELQFDRAFSEARPVPQTKSPQTSRTGSAVRATTVPRARQIAPASPVVAVATAPSAASATITPRPVATIAVRTLAPASRPATIAPKSANLQKPMPVRAWLAAAGPQQAARTEFEAQLVSLANASQGRIGVAAMDIATGNSVAVLGDQPFPMASTSKIAIVATFLDGVDKGRWELTDRFPMMMPVGSARFSGAKAPVRAGQVLPATTLIELALTRSDNHATDALLAVVGGPQAVSRWIKSTGISGLRLDRDIATLVRDDGQYDPARMVDPRDSATPLAMVQLLEGLYEGQWLSKSSRGVLIGAMERCLTGRHRIRAGLPVGTRVAHKTGTLNNTASDVGFIHTPDGRVLAVAIYVTGQGGRANRDSRIATIARAIFDGYQTDSASVRR